MKASSCQHITSITQDDYALYRTFFEWDNRVACYGNSWLYITQACRGFGLGLKYYDQDTLFSIGLHNGHYVIVRPLGSLDQRLMDLLAWLQQDSGKPVFIKKLFPEQVARLCEMGEFVPAATYSAELRRACPGEYPWDATAFADDDTYPELIYNMELTGNHRVAMHDWFKQLQELRRTPTSWLEFKRLREYYREFRRRLNNFELSATRYSMTPYGTWMADDIRYFLQRYFSVHPQNLDAYENMLTSFSLNVDNSPLRCFVIFNQVSSEPSGYFCVERLDEQSIGQYAAIAVHNPSGLAHYALVQMMRSFQKENVQYMNVGGSETASLQTYKLKPGPVEERYMQMLVYGV